MDDANATIELESVSTFEHSSEVVDTGLAGLTGLKSGDGLRYSDALRNCV